MSRLGLGLELELGLGFKEEEDSESTESAGGALSTEPVHYLLFFIYRAYSLLRKHTTTESTNGMTIINSKVNHLLELDFHQHHLPLAFSFI